MFRAPKKSSGNNATAIEAIEKIVQEKKISTKINYDVLRSLSGPSLANTNRPDDSKDPYKEEIEPPGIFGDSPMSTDLRESSYAGTSKLLRNSSSVSDRKESNIPNENNSWSIKRKLSSTRISDTKIGSNSIVSSESKIQKLSNKDIEQPLEKQDSREVVVETGPVDSRTISYENEELDEFEDEDDEDIPQSAAELLSKHRGDDAAEISDYEEEYYWMYFLSVSNGDIFTVKKSILSVNLRLYKYHE